MIVEHMIGLGLQPIKHSAPDGSPLERDETYMRRTLFGDYVFDAYIEDDQVLTLYVLCARFAAFMRHVEKGFSNVRFDEVSKRMMRKDNEGCLAFVVPGVREHQGQLILESGGISPTGAELRRELDHIHSPASVFEFLYGGTYISFFPKIEGVWVYLFLLFEAGTTADEAFRRVNSEPQESIRREWRLKRAVKPDDVVALKAAFDSLQVR